MKITRRVRDTDTSGAEMHATDPKRHLEIHTERLLREYAHQGAAAFKATRRRLTHQEREQGDGQES